MKPLVLHHPYPCPACAICPWRRLALFIAAVKRITSSLAKGPGGRKFYYYREERKFQLEHQRKFHRFPEQF